MDGGDMYKDVLDKLQSDAYWHWIPPGGEIPRVNSPTSVDFLREYAAKNLPCIITGIMDDWPTEASWDCSENLINKLGKDKLIHVNLTPQGKGDFLVKEKDRFLFVKPYQTKLTVKDFFHKLKHKEESNMGVPYLSSQNDNLNTELFELKSWVPTKFDFAVEAFGNDPEATNIWIGDERSISSLHNDFYENIYSVVTASNWSIQGVKVFHLMPPCAKPFLYEKECMGAQYSFDANSNTWKIIEDSTRVTWSPLDPVDLLNKESRTFEEYPLAKLASNLIVRAEVHAGETLYLPAMWYHRVTQTEETVAINYWHNMSFDHKWVYYNFLDSFTTLMSQHKIKEAELRIL